MLSTTCLIHIGWLEIVLVILDVLFLSAVVHAVREARAGRRIRRRAFAWAADPGWSDFANIFMPLVATMAATAFLIVRIVGTWGARC